jgi:hypothetical protein
MDDKPMEIPFVLKPGEPFEFEAPSCVELRQVDAADDAEFLDDEDNWTTDPTAAFSLLDKMPYFEINKSQYTYGETYYIVFLDDQMIGHEEDGKWQGEGSTLEIAICNAYLAWKESQQQAAQP